MAKSWKRKYYDLRNKKYKKKTSISLPSVAQVILGGIGGWMVLGPNAVSALFSANPIEKRLQYCAESAFRQAPMRKGSVVAGLGLMTLPTLARKTLGWRKSSTRIMKIGPVAVDVL